MNPLGPCGTVGMGHEALNAGYGDGSRTTVRGGRTTGGSFWTTITGDIGYSLGEAGWNWRSSSSMTGVGSRESILNRERHVDGTRFCYQFVFRGRMRILDDTVSHSDLSLDPYRTQRNSKTENNSYLIKKTTQNIRLGD